MSPPAIVWLEDEGPHHPGEWAVQALHRGGAIVFPTDTVYGLMAAHDSEAGYRRIYELKGRAHDRPLALLIAGGTEIYRFTNLACYKYFGSNADSMIEEFAGGTSTLILRPEDLPGLPSTIEELQPGPVGLRCPTRRPSYDQPVWATSVNRSGQPPATTADEVLAWLDELAELGIEPPELVVLSRTPGSGQPSRVVDLTGPEPRFLR